MFNMSCDLLTLSNVSRGRDESSFASCRGSCCKPKFKPNLKVHDSIMAIDHRSDVANLDFLNDHSCWCFDFHPDPHTSGTKCAIWSQYRSGPNCSIRQPGREYSRIWNANPGYDIIGILGTAKVIDGIVICVVWPQ